ncbi:hypothetical protein D9619_005663 [Psilocybe cf. subviscida]|uniref:PNK3P-domain-containing protein n=1 Tax=Psilocybe cf. subviscida TaxID=2480587 RepID=A0A8H5FBC4_9AGAR|nr:hypothetical protein D9619_005663 [Psilocybe cf. subviscida]
MTMGEAGSSGAEPGPSKKRKSNDDPSDAPAKVVKTHPFFMKPEEKRALDASSNSAFQWLKSLGTQGSCLHGINLQPAATSKVAALDLDGTLIKQEFGKSNFAWWNSRVPQKLRDLHGSGHSIIIISNQGIKPAALKTWKEKISSIAKSLEDVPFRLLAATQKDQYRKPMPGMWYEVERIFSEEGVAIDKASSFFVGDAAGRRYAKGKEDFSCSDRKWADNVQLKFYTPEEFFLELPPHPNYTMPGFRPSSLPTLPHVMPTASPTLPEDLQQEVVIFVGYPSLGKSTFFKQYFEPAGYIHINQDTLKTREKCVKVMKEALADGKSCVIDNTNRNVATRKLYLDACKAAKVPSRCFLFEGSMDLAWHNNLYRAFNMPPSSIKPGAERSLLPYVAFTGFRDNYEEPDLEEGFKEIKKVNWVFQGTEEETKRWSMWLQISGK